MKPLCAYFDYISFKIQKVILVVEYYLIERKRIRSSKLMFATDLILCVYPKAHLFLHRLWPTSHRGVSLH